MKVLRVYNVEGARTEASKIKKNYISITNCHTRIRIMSSERKTLKVVFHAGLTRMRRHVSAIMLGITCRKKWLGWRWIGRSGPTVWTPKSPDLTPLDFFLVGLCEEQCAPCQGKLPSTPESLHKGRCGYDNTKHASSNLERGRISSGYLSCHQGSPH
jgi:hypothetical protein